MDSLPYKTNVTDLLHISDDIILIRLQRPDGFCYEAGQYIHLQYKDLPVRPYSLASSPSRDDMLELHIKRAPHGQLSSALCQVLTKGDELHISEAKGTNTYQPHEGQMICVAGGIGIVPVKALIEEALHNEQKTSIHLIWGVMTETDLYLNNLFTRLSETHNNFDYQVIIGGVVTDALMPMDIDAQSTKVHLCGPPPMIEACQDLFIQKNLPREHILYDPYKATS